jgi:hypothetical protein
MESKLEDYMAIDEVSKMIGNFESLLKTHGNTLEEIRDSMDEMRNYQKEQNGKVERISAWKELITDPDEGDLTIAVRNSTDWAETKKKVKWLAGLGVVGGTAGSFSFGKFLSNLLGHFNA